jgi:AcrR family transcriptional regulator
MQRKSAAVRREEIVQAALSLIAMHGPGALTTAAIAQQVGVSQGAVFKHFASKTAILVACVEWIGEQIRPAVRAAALGPGSAEQRLRRIVAALLGVASRIPAMPTTMFSRELHTEYPQLCEALRERRQAFAKVLGELLEGGRRSGEFAAELDVGTATYLIMGMVHGLLFRWHHIDHHLDLDREARLAIDLLLNGLKPRRDQADPASQGP